MNLIDLSCKKNIKKLTKILNNGGYQLDNDSTFEIYKPNGISVYVLTKNSTEETILKSSNFLEVAKAYNKNVQDYHKKKIKISVAHIDVEIKEKQKIDFARNIVTDIIKKISLLIMFSIFGKAIAEDEAKKILFHLKSLKNSAKKLGIYQEKVEDRKA